MSNHPSDIPETCCPVCKGDGELTEDEVAEVEAEAEALAALRRIVRRSLASHQLEKLEDARIYLGDEPQGAPSGWCATAGCENHVSGPGLRRCWEHGFAERARLALAIEPRGAPPIVKNCPKSKGDDWCVLPEGHKGFCQYDR